MRVFFSFISGLDFDCDKDYLDPTLPYVGSPIESCLNGEGEIELFLPPLGDCTLLILFIYL